MKNQAKDIQDAITTLRSLAQAQVQAYITVLDKLNTLAAGYQFQSYSDMEKLTEADAVANSLRNTLREAMSLESNSSLPKSYYDALFKVQLLLALYWPCNGRESNGFPSDPLYNCDGLNPKMLVIAVSAGHLYVKSALKDFYQRGFGRETNTASQQPYFVTPMREELTARDIAYLKEQGIVFPALDAVIDCNNIERVAAEEVKEENNALPQQPEVVENNPGNNVNVVSFLFRALGKFYNREDNDRQLDQDFNRMDEVLSVSMVAGGIIAGTAGVVLLLAGLTVLIPLLTVTGNIAIGALGAGAALVKLIDIAMENEWDARRRPPGILRVSGVILAAMTAGILGVGLLTLAAPYIISGLAVASIVSASAAASLAAGIGIIQIALPSLLGFIGCAKELSRAGAMSQFLESIALTPIVACFAVGAGLGAGFLSIAQSLLHVMGLRRNPPPPAPAGNGNDEYNPLLQANRGVDPVINPDLINRQGQEALAPAGNGNDEYNPLLQANRGADPVINPDLINRQGQNRADIYRQLGLNGEHVQAQIQSVVAPVAVVVAADVDAPPSPRAIAALEAIVDAADREEELRNERGPIPGQG